MLEDLFSDPRGREVLTSQPAEESETLPFQLMMAEIVDHIQGAPALIKQTAALRELVAPFGGVHFFYDEKGDFCLLADFLQ